MLSPELRRRLVPLAVFGLPVAMAKSTAWLLTPAGVAAETAAGPAPVPTVTSSAAREWTDAQIEAGRHVVSMAAIAVGPDPMFYPSLFKEPAQAADPVNLGALEVKVEGVMESSTGNVAVVNGNLRKVGDLIDGGPWRVAAIDAAARAVDLVNGTTGERRRATVPMPRRK